MQAKKKWKKYQQHYLKLKKRESQMPKNACCMMPYVMKLKIGKLFYGNRNQLYVLGGDDSKWVWENFWGGGKKRVYFC